LEKLYQRLTMQLGSLSLQSALFCLISLRKTRPAIFVLVRPTRHITSKWWRW